LFNLVLQDPPPLILCGGAIRKKNKPVRSGARGFSYPAVGPGWTQPSDQCPAPPAQPRRAMRVAVSVIRLDYPCRSRSSLRAPASLRHVKPGPRSPPSTSETSAHPSLARSHPRRHSDRETFALSGKRHLRRRIAPFRRAFGLRHRGRFCRSTATRQGETTRTITSPSALTGS